MDQVASADLSTVAKTIDSGFVPVSFEIPPLPLGTCFPKSLDRNACPGQVLHGDAVLDNILVNM